MRSTTSPDTAAIGVFDSGLGGLTVLEGLRRKLPARDFVYLGDHAHAPYGERDHAEIVALTQHACETLFAAGCPLVVLACNTATAVAARTLQREWLSGAWPSRRILGIIAPTVEYVTQTPWHVTTPVFPQRYNDDVVALFGTAATVRTGVYAEEVRKRCPHVRLVSRGCPGLVPRIENGDPAGELPGLVAAHVAALLADVPEPPHWAILGCTHFPLVEDLFRAALPPETRVVGQPVVVANALEDYLDRHGELRVSRGGRAAYLTTGDAAEVRQAARRMLRRDVPFAPLHALGAFSDHEPIVIRERAP